MRILPRSYGRSSTGHHITGVSFIAISGNKIVRVMALMSILTVPNVHAQSGPEISCDVDEDGDVDFDDFLVLSSCQSGPAMMHNGSQPCRYADSNSDGHVDVLDFRNLQACFSGSGNAAAAGCAIRPIGIALSLPCGSGNPPDPSQTNGQDLQKVTINAPNAICNDGSPGVMYIRRAAAPAQNNRWVFYIEAGGSCDDLMSCAARWCGTGPIYTAAKMSSHWAYDSIEGVGIFNRPASVLASANLVFFYYCSSDLWAGQRSNVVFSAEGDPTLSYTLHFRGHRILEAGLEMLLSGPVTSDSGEETLPALSDATQVLVTGSSAGSVGARYHLDWIASHFNSAQTTVRGVFDTGHVPLGEMFGDPSVSQMISDASQAKVEHESDLYNSFWDQSCVSMLEGTPDWWRCGIGTYTALNHITTPFFQRMDLTDSNPTSSFQQAFGVTVDEFAAATIGALALLPNIGTTAAEADQIDFVPGVYGPNCGQHLALTTDNYFLASTVDDGGGVPRTFDESLRAWLLGGGVFIVDEHPALMSSCLSRTGNPFVPSPIDAGSVERKRHSVQRIGG